MVQLSSKETSRVSPPQAWAARRCMRQCICLLASNTAAFNAGARNRDPLENAQNNQKIVVCANCAPKARFLLLLQNAPQNPNFTNKNQKIPTRPENPHPNLRLREILKNPHPKIPTRLKPYFTLGFAPARNDGYTSGKWRLGDQPRCGALLQRIDFVG